MAEAREIKIHGIYRHFKNKYYIVEDVHITLKLKKNTLYIADFMMIIPSGFVRKKNFCPKQTTSNTLT